MTNDPIFPPIEYEPSRWRLLGGNIIIRGRHWTTAAVRGYTQAHHTSSEFSLRLTATLPPCSVAGSVVE